MSSSSSSLPSANAANALLAWCPSWARVLEEIGASVGGARAAARVDGRTIVHWAGWRVGVAVGVVVGAARGGVPGGVVGAPPGGVVGATL